MPGAPSNRLIYAERIAAHGIAGDRIGARTAAAADVLELTQAALPFDQRVVTHAQEYRRIAVDVHQCIGPDIAADEI